MSTVDTNTATPARRPPWVILALLVAVLGISVALIASHVFRRSPDAAKPAVVAPAIQTAAATLEAPKAGDLTISQEAMELAEIQLAPAQSRLVTEKLPVSGTVEAGGDAVVKITPRMAGKVLTVAVVPGDAVRVGQTLAQMESVVLAQSQAAYRQAATRLAVARSTLQRQRRLAALGTFGQPPLEEARRAAVAAEGEVNVAQNEVAAATAAVAEAQSQVGALRAAVAQSQTQVKVSESRFRRQEALLKEELTSRQDWEQAQADFERAGADVDAAQANLAQGQAKVATVQAHLQAARARLAEAQQRAGIAAQTRAREEAVYRGGYGARKEIVEAEAAVRQVELEQQSAAQSVRLLGGRPGGGSVVALTSPIAGRVQERSVTLGETVDTEHALFTVIDLRQVWAQLAVTPHDLPLVRLGQRVELTAETAPGRVFSGTISATSSTADEQTRTVRVRCALANPGDALRPGTFVRGQLITAVRRERVVAPVSALQEHNGKPTLYVAVPAHPGSFEVRHVKLGVRGDRWREISAGLRPGERIAVNGTFYLKSEALKSFLADACCATGPAE